MKLKKEMIEFNEQNLKKPIIKLLGLTKKEKLRLVSNPAGKVQYIPTKMLKEIFDQKDIDFTRKNPFIALINIDDHDHFITIVRCKVSYPDRKITYHGYRITRKIPVYMLTLGRPVRGIMYDEPEPEPEPEPGSEPGSEPNPNE